MVIGQLAHLTKKVKIMKILKEEKGFQLQQIGNFFQVIDDNGDSWGYRDTLRKAENLFKSILSNYN